MPDEDDDMQRPARQEARRQTRADSRTDARGDVRGAVRTEQPVRSDPGRRRRRESFLADLDEAQRLLERVAPRRTRLAQLRQQQLMRTYLH
jgi:hypothetical protein